MTQEDKELLIRDLTARLPYKVKCKYYDYCEGDYEERIITGYDDREYMQIEGVCIYVEDVKPYLFPLSSLTSKQRTEIGKILTDIQKQYSPYGVVNTEGCDDLFICSVKQSNALINYCLSQHLDINGLIEKGFAEDATGLNIY